MTDPTTFKRRTAPNTSANIFLIFLSVLTKTNFTSHTPMNEAKKKKEGGGGALLPALMEISPALITNTRIYVLGQESADD